MVNIYCYLLTLILAATFLEFLTCPLFILSWTNPWDTGFVYISSIILHKAFQFLGLHFFLDEEKNSSEPLAYDQEASFNGLQMQYV